MTGDPLRVADRLGHIAQPIDRIQQDTPWTKPDSGRT
jgi:hypothetical protein